MTYQTQRLDEKETPKVILDNKEITTEQFNRILESLEPNQRIIETSHHNFHLVERMWG